ncbi:uncharacterized protein PAC_18103 [Phialocephala subalpina]|uniref:Uncharacterized protein n=1 Tax=Phialocephala subalpina TaxID=576137 RepID=A0A1L7XT26_9HELO|nr:uncharacterized protein PAC_18103 [Phialocephala subalpina]
MATSAWIFETTLRKRDSIRRTIYSASIPIGSATMSLGMILIIAICGALLLFAAVTIGIIFHVKRRNRFRNKVRIDVPDHEMIRSDPRTTMRSIRTPEIFFPRRMSRGLSFNPWAPLDGGITTSSSDWQDVDLSDHAPPLATAQRPSFHRGVARVRESWPLASNIPLKLLPSQTTMILSPVAPPGYVVPQPKRQSIKLVRRRESADCSPTRSKSGSPTRDLYPAPLSPKKRSQRRSASETPTLLRSASQKLKVAHRKSLTRTLTTLNRISGRAPTKRLLTPPIKQAAESREQLINKEFSQTMEDIGTGRMTIQTEGGSLLLQPADGIKSPTPSFTSTDSLCEAQPEVIIAALSSPSKSSLNNEKRHRVRISEATTIIQTSIHEDDPVMIVAKPEEQYFALPHRISLAGDPFFSSVRSSKTIVSTSQVQGPRPMYFRKSTFGHEESPNRPEDYISPLRDVSSNSQASPKPPHSQDETEEHNPFRWSPQEAMKAKVTPLSGRTSPNRKGHRRSNVIRMSHLVSRPMSSVPVVQEEPEEESPRKSIRFSLPPATAIRVFEPEKSPSPSSSTTSRRRSMRPPSSATFSPDLTITEGVPTTPASSPVSKMDRRSFSIYSPTLSVCNYYTESNGGSEDEFFNQKPKRVSVSTLKSRRHGQDFSTDLTLFPTNQMQQNHQLSLISFPPPPSCDPTQPECVMTVLTPPPLRPLPTIASTMTGFSSTSPSPAPPLLTTSSNTQLYGPRDLPSRPSTLSPPRDSLASSISMLRRMNSQISQYSSQSTIAEEIPAFDSEKSPQLPPHPHFSLNFNLEEAQAEERGRSRGSRHYLAIGRQSQYNGYGNSNSYSRNSRPGDRPRESWRIGKSRKRNTYGKEDFSGFEDVREEKELTPVPESSPATEANALGIINLRFPTLSKDGKVRNLPTPPRSREKAFEIEKERKVIDLDEAEIVDAKLVEDEEADKENLHAKGSLRWSDAMAKPARTSSRRDSQMKYPSPQGNQTPPKWSISGLGLAGQRLLGTEKVDLTSPERPHSLGLYDDNGFLRSSPEMKERRKKARESKVKVEVDEWHSVM